MGIINTKYGKIRGLETKNSCVYKAIPYAKPPVGVLRFRPPQAPDSWDDVRDCGKFPPMAIQKLETADSFYGKEFFSYPEFNVDMSEDCLYLNVWTPKYANNCPVAIWYHGGGFQGGNGAEAEFVH